MMQGLSRQVVLGGYACRYPDATTPEELFANIVARRQSFRVVPKERLDLSDYHAAAIGEADSITPVLASLLTDWQFDPRRFRIPKDTFASTDLVHWLALETADAAVSACGGIANFPRDRTGVVVANTLTGEFSRTSQLRLRWPWLDRELAGVLEGADLDAETQRRIRGALRDRVHATFPAPDEETLAGGLANTIAGRIANYFDLHGGAWLVDAACASSLVALANAAEQVASGRVDAMIVVGVDLSLDPFELVGFSRNGAMTARRMRAFDTRADGFWPGEGAGAVILGTRRWAEKHGIEAPVELAGWGLSSDGRGGLTRPEVSGQLRALTEAYERFGLDPHDLCFVEAHGTGTAVGDPAEIEALSLLLKADTAGRRVPVGSIKGNIGHTKAAAGLAGLIKAAEGLRTGIVPPHAGCLDPHPIFAGTGDRLAVSRRPEELRGDASACLAGVSSFGFGGINAHAVLRVAPRAVATISSLPAQTPWSEDELFVFAHDDAAGLADILVRLRARATTASLSEVRDLAAAAARDLHPGTVRLAFVAGRPDELCRKIDQALLALEGQECAGIFVGRPTTVPRIGLLFPGQGAPCRTTAGAWGERFGITQGPFVPKGDPGHTSNAQPLIVGAALAGLELLDRLGVKAEVALGHSLGELPALHWAGAVNRTAILDIAAARGAAMGALPGGAMLHLSCDSSIAVELIDGSEAEIACLNGPRETVVAGDYTTVEEIARRATARGFAAQPLNVSHAFHSRTMADAGAALRAAVASAHPVALKRTVMSTVTGTALPPDQSLTDLLIDQLVRPVRFAEAATRFGEACDIAIEVGPGGSMSRLIQGQKVPSASLDVFASSCIGAFESLARLHVAGVALHFAALYPAEGYRPARMQAPKFLTNPCGTFDDRAPTPPAAVMPLAAAAASPAGTVSGDTCLDQLVSLVAAKTGLDPRSIDSSHRFLDDLHLNSLAVNRILAALAQHRGIALPGHRTAFSNASLREVAEELAGVQAGGLEVKFDRVTGVARWVRRFRTAWLVADAGPVDRFDWVEVALGAALPQDSLAIAIRIDTWDGERDAPRLVAIAQQAVGACRHLALIHGGAPVAGFVRTLAAEGLFETVRAIDVSDGDMRPALPGGSPVVSIDSDGTVRAAALALDEQIYREGADATTIVVTGGARGIGAEVAMALAERSGAAIVLVGRSAAQSSDVASTLANAAQRGLRVGYAQASVEDPDDLRQAIAAWTARFGPVSHLVHAAGINNPVNFIELDIETLARTMAPKGRGLDNVIAACGPDLARVVTFGSIIGVLGLHGEAHYALANAEQARRLARVARDNPALSTLNIDWSVWAGAGMGDRLGVIDQLAAEGIDAIPLDDAIRQATDLILSNAAGSIVVASRYAADVPLAGVPPLRYLDRTLLYTPGVELVCETVLNEGRDPALSSHRVDGLAVMPGVLLLEAMAEIAAQLIEGGTIGAIETVEFRAAISVGIDGRRIRVAALREPGGAITCEVRSDEDGFAAPVVRATLHAARAPISAAPRRIATAAGHPAQALYGPLFFHGAAFQHVATIAEVSSRTIEARLAPTSGGGIFGVFEPQDTVLGDPVLRDCGLHLLQACVPHRRVLPVRTARIDLTTGGAAVTVNARELWTRGSDYAFDIEWRDADGVVVERWHEAVFREAGGISIAPVLAAMPGLLRPYVERLARETTGDDSLQCSIVVDAAMQRDNRRAVALGALGVDPAPAHRGDGAPLFAHGVHCSLSHSDAATLAVRGDQPIGCDVVALSAFPEDGEAARWAALEALRKIGAIGELRSTDGRSFRTPSGECAMILPPLDMAGIPHLASIAFVERGRA